MNPPHNSRRAFLKKAGFVSAGITILPSHVVSGLGHKAPSEKFNALASANSYIRHTYRTGWNLPALP